MWVLENLLWNIINSFNMTNLQNGVVIKMTNVVCESKNKSWVIVEKCRLRALQRNKTVINLFIDALHPVYNIIVGYEIQKRANGYKPWVIKGAFNLCKYMKGLKGKFESIVFDQIREYTTLNHTCPYVVSNTCYFTILLFESGIIYIHIYLGQAIH